MPAITIRPVLTRQDLDGFLRFPRHVYGSDPNWVPPLISEQAKRLDQTKNPYFAHARMQMFLAQRNGDPVGTISATINERRNDHLGVADGYFGFFECIEDPDVATVLIDTAVDFCRDCGMTMLKGPINLDESEELGVLVDGFDTRPAVLLSHSRPYYAGYLERLGFIKWYDTRAWMLTRDDIGGSLENLPRKLFIAAERVRQRDRIIVRPLDMRHLDDEIHRLYEMWNVTIALVNRSFVPIEKAELKHMVDAMSQLIDPDLVRVAEAPDSSRPSGRRPVGFAVALPDVNQILGKADGRLFPLGWAKLMWHSRRIDALTFKLLGVIPEFRHRGIEGALMLDVIQAAWDKGYKTCDMSVIDESNHATERLLSGLGAYPYRTYRVYQRPV